MCKFLCLFNLDLVSTVPSILLYFNVTELAKGIDLRDAKQIRFTLGHIRQDGLEGKLSDGIRAAEKLLTELDLENERARENEEQRKELDRVNREVFRLQNSEFVIVGVIGIV